MFVTDTVPPKNSIPSSAPLITATFSIVVPEPTAYKDIPLYSESALIAAPVPLITKFLIEPELSSSVVPP